MQDSQYATDWVVANLIRYGDMLHLLHCVPRGRPPSVLANPSGSLLLDPEASAPQTDAAMDDAKARVAEIYCKKLEAASVRVRRVLCVAALTEHNAQHHATWSAHTAHPQCPHPLRCRSS